MRRAALAALCAALWMCAGCLRPQPAPRLVSYVLRPERPAAAPEPLRAGALYVERLRAAPLFEGKGFVYRTSERGFESDFYSRFAAPPAVLVRDALADWLAQSGLFSAVQRSGDPAQARWWLEGRVTALYADLRQPAAPVAVVAMDLALLDARSPALEKKLGRPYRAEVPASADPAALAGAWSQGLGQIFSELEAELRALLASQAAEQAMREAGRAPRASPQRAAAQRAWR